MYPTFQEFGTLSSARWLTAARLKVVEIVIDGRGALLLALFGGIWLVHTSHGRNIEEAVQPSGGPPRLVPSCMTATMKPALSPLA